MRIVRIGAMAMALAALGACVPRAVPPAPEPPPGPQAPPAPPPSVPPPLPAASWLDAALSPGDWSYRREGANSAAAFGVNGPDFLVRCETGGRIALTRTGAAQAGPMTIRTTHGDRNLPAAVTQAPSPALVALLAASDPLLDRMVFSRGRFAVEAPGLPPLVLPAWPEMARVVEDCRS